MALNQQFTAPPGLKLTCRVEQPAEPGQPRLFWDGIAKAWTGDPRARLELDEDPHAPGVYRILEATEHTAPWPAKTYWLTVLEVPAAAGPLAAPPRLVSHGPVQVIGGDDGSRPAPSVDLPWPDGRVIHVRGAYAR